MYSVRKTFTHATGLSCAFRQWRADSHCNLIHGYALEVSLHITATQLNACNWVFDFGAFKGVKRHLEAMFDHKLAVAEDDPLLNEFLALEKLGGCEVRVMMAVGCEAFAKAIYDEVHSLVHNLSEGYATLESVTVREHGGNEATYFAN